MPRMLHILTGPTSVGKTELALAWAEAHGAEIVSCDALLFYRGMDLGTAKPTAAERARDVLVGGVGGPVLALVTALAAAAGRAVVLLCHCHARRGRG